MMKINRLIYSLLLIFIYQNSLQAQTFRTAAEIASDMTVGWNIGNTMEALYNNNGTIVANENAWGNPNITQRLIDSVKSVGFNTIRIPVAWDVHSTNNVIDAAWIARVKEVVDYCVNNDMYIILNIHWDYGWLEENCTTAAQANNNIKQNTYWTQIANYFKSYDDHLLFASANEPNVDDATQMSVLLSYHQTFINAVRATGGNNAYRTLIVQGPRTDIEVTNTLMTTMPSDSSPDRLMAEVHFYPYQFSLMTEDAGWGNQFYYWGACNHSSTDAAHNPTWGEEAWVDEMFQLMKTQFVDNGYPVIIGEFGVRKRTELSGDAYNLHVRSREYYFKYVVKSALQHGLIPVYWCAGLGDLFDRNTGDVLDRGTLNALMAGAYSTSSSVNCEENDCMGIAGGHAYTNSCSDCVLGGYTVSCGTYDCNGDLNGTAYLDNCGVCVEGNTGKTPCIQDCNGDWGGSAYLDNCSSCVGGNTSQIACTQDCYGDWGGTAYLDNCNECVGGNTMKTACAPKIEEAEDISCSFDGTIDSNNPGFTGSGFVNGDNSAGTTITLKMYASNAVDIMFGIQYANGGVADRPCQVLVDGNEVIASFSMPVNSWTTYESVVQSIHLEQGINTITLVALSTNGFANIDFFSIYGDAEFLPCEITQSIDLSAGWNLISIYAHAQDSSIETLFNGLDVAVVKNANGFWKAGQIPEMNSLTHVTAGNGYLVYMNVAETLSITGEFVLTNVTVSLTGGWQLIGYPGCADPLHCGSIPFSNDFNSTNTNEIKNFEGFWMPDGTMNSIDSFEPGKGYYLNK